MSETKTKTPVAKIDSGHGDNDKTLEDELEFSPKQQRQIIHRVDRRLILMLGFLHMVSLIDRGNVGTASVAGMTKELQLVGMRYVSSTNKHYYLGGNNKSRMISQSLFSQPTFAYSHWAPSWFGKSDP